MHLRPGHTAQFLNDILAAAETVEDPSPVRGALFGAGKVVRKAATAKAKKRKKTKKRSGGTSGGSKG